ncbi:MAG: hypothetical protein ACRCXT_03005 [Paraclostridium sp.]
MTINNPIIIKVEVDEFIMSYLEGLHFDINGYREVINSILKDDRYNEVTYDKFMKEYKELNREYEYTKNVIIADYTPANYKTSEYSCVFDFIETCIVINKIEGCGCSVK